VFYILCFIIGICVNLKDSFRCDCQLGFKLDNNGKCKDINECEENEGLCYKGSCINTLGSFKCDCKVGFVVTFDGRYCTGMMMIEKLITSRYK
jgi:hypothetical protein